MWDILIVSKFIKSVRWRMAAQCKSQHYISLASNLINYVLWGNNCRIAVATIFLIANIPNLWFSWVLQNLGLGQKIMLFILVIWIEGIESLFWPKRKVPSHWPLNVRSYMCVHLPHKSSFYIYFILSFADKKYCFIFIFIFSFKIIISEQKKNRIYCFSLSKCVLFFRCRYRNVRILK